MVSVASFRDSVTVTTPPSTFNRILYRSLRSEIRGCQLGEGLEINGVVASLLCGEATQLNVYGHVAVIFLLCVGIYSHWWPLLNIQN